MKKHGATILVVDDEREIVRALQQSLTAHGYTVLVARSGEEALEVLATQRPDLMLLDLLLPGMSGLDVCKRVREISAVPILVLSVKESERDKVEALDLGADDYVAKPFGMDEVLARVRVALRHAARVSRGTEPHLHIGPLFVDLAARRVLVSGQEVSLTPTEYDLLRVFLSYRGKILTRQQLLTAVWGAQPHNRMHSLHVYVAQLRQKIEPDSEHPRLIITVPGVGYRFAERLDSEEQGSESA